MELPKTYKGFAKLLIKIAEKGNDYKRANPDLHERDDLQIGEVVADIQNWLGENDILLRKMNLKYNG